MYCHKSVNMVSLLIAWNWLASEVSFCTNEENIGRPGMVNISKTESSTAVEDV